MEFKKKKIKHNKIKYKKHKYNEISYRKQTQIYGGLTLPCLHPLSSSS